MDRSIRKEMMIAFTGLILCMVLISAIANIFFLEKFYTSNKKEDLLYTKEQLEKLVRQDMLLDESTKVFLQRIIEKGNIAFLVLSESGEVIASTSTSQDLERLEFQLLSYQLDKITDRIEIIIENDEYIIAQASDLRNELEYIEMWGYFSTGEAYIIRTPMESIRASVDIAGRFLLYVATLVILVSSIFVWYFANKLTKPLLQLAAISKKMADLEFDVKYENDSYEEIGILGDSFNAMSDKLEKTISELKIANNELLQDIERREKTEEMRTEFLGNVSHELKTPIALIQGYAEGLSENINDDLESKEFYCEVIMDEAEKMNELVKSLLELNQLEFGGANNLVERFDIVEMINGILVSLDIITKQKEATIQLSTNEKVYVWADQFKVEHVIRNYITNALNHLDHDKIINIKIVKDDKVRISVFNTGKQIPEEDIEFIWDKFYKVDKARTREYGGNGIGLSIVKAIMNSMHQEFGVKNYSNGVEFWFELDCK